MENNNLLDQYFEYIQTVCPELELDSWLNFAEQLEITDFQEPKSSLDFNNLAVMALIEAEKTDDLYKRQKNVREALEFLKQGIELDEHPLCLAHFALIQGLIGNNSICMNISINGFVSYIHFFYHPSKKMPLGLVYFPPKSESLAGESSQQLENILNLENGYSQTIYTYISCFISYNYVFYNDPGKRFLRLCSSIVNNSPVINCQLGISLIYNQENDGLFYLQKAVSVLPDYARAYQALYLAYRDLKGPEFISFWHGLAQEYLQKTPDSLDWIWASLPIDSQFTYLAFEDYLLTIEPTLSSVVTAVLLAQGDWFETEMELWRTDLQAGMTVIDVGANVGVYTFSAARCVGPTGKVIAIEPFKTCVECLLQTCEVNQLDWVKVYGAAASDRTGSAFLNVHNASVFNEVISDEEVTLKPESMNEIKCITLDSLIESENLSSLDWLKIDAEGHEMKVLKGAERLIEEFRPKIMYENMNANGRSNNEVQNFLMEKGYRLFFYRAYVRQLVPINSPKEVEQILNLIAIPAAEFSD